MRTDANITAKDPNTNVPPYVTVEVDLTGEARPSDSGGADNGGSWTRIDNLSSKQRIIKITHHEEPYGSQAVIMLNNYDSSYDDYDAGGSSDLLGKWIRIGRGLGSDISYPAYHKVVALDCDSKPYSNRNSPKDQFTIYTEGAWSLLQRYIIPADLYYNQSDLDATRNNFTVQDIVNDILEDAGLDLGTDISIDDYVDTHEPVIDAIADTSAFAFILTLLEPYNVYLLARIDSMYFLSGNTGDEKTFVTPADGVYKPVRESKKRAVLSNPLKVEAESINGDYTGSYTDDNWDSSLGSYLYVDYNGVITSNAECDDIAEAIVKRAKSNQVSGWFRTYTAECLLELYDTVTLTDTRGNTSA